MAVEVSLWTDGSGVVTGGPGGWAYVLRAVDLESGEVLKEVEGSGGVPETTTNNRMEMQAAIEGLLALERPTTVVVYSDSKYLVHAFEYGWAARWVLGGWRNREGEPVANQDLWMTLIDATTVHRIEWRHIPGHALDYACECGWSEPRPKRGRRLKTCPMEGCEAQPGLIDRYPPNARCDVLAGEERRRILDRNEDPILVGADGTPGAKNDRARDPR